MIEDNGARASGFADLTLAPELRHGLIADALRAERGGVVDDVVVAEIDSGGAPVPDHFLEGDHVVAVVPHDDVGEVQAQAGGRLQFPPR